MLQVEHDTLTREDGDFGPRGEGSLRCLHGGRHLLVCGTWYACDELVGGLEREGEGGGERERRGKRGREEREGEGEEGRGRGREEGVTRLSQCSRCTGRGPLTGLCTSSHSEVALSTNLPSMNN